MKRLQRWELPSNYIGAEWPEYFVFLGQHRDSDCLTRSNFVCGLEAIGGEQANEASEELPLVHIVRENHWAVGWVEWIAIHESAIDALAKADEIMEKLARYPVVNEEHFYQLEQEEAEEVWRKCYDVSDRVQFIRDHRKEFEFRSLGDCLDCVRGKYFVGYASSLLS